MTAHAHAPAIADQDIAHYNGPRNSTTALVLDPNSMKAMLDMAGVMSKGVATVPKHLQKNEADCLAVVMQAMQWRMNPFAVAQKTHLVNGVLGYEAQLVNAVITSLAPTTGRLHFEWYGPWEKVIGKFHIKNSDKGQYRVPGWKLEDEEGCGVKVFATLVGEDQPRVLELLLAQARTRNSTLWADDPKQQLAYLAIKRWSRLYCPDVILGVYTRDELEDGFERSREINPNAPSEPVSAPSAVSGRQDEETLKLYEQLEASARDGGLAGFEAAWKALTPKQRIAIGTERKDRLKEMATTSDADFVEVPDEPGVAA
ncbi:RecT family recombinase [Pseudomonas sp.]|jgi:hypothetical protein|uniref:RecT family recombinase n=1 Tax=Pseudomonas sp. TaxID=306 RepID=UPI002EDA4766